MKLCGIDEAGRGCIAGSLVVAGVVLNNHIDGLNDSKKLSEKKREELYEQIILHSTYHIVSFSAQSIDNLGLSFCIKSALEEIMKTITCDKFLFDGNSTFGVKNLDTMIKADAIVAEVSAASILAKVTRDREIDEYAKEMPHFYFDKHKGYGTAHHVELIKKYGYSPIHRKSFKLKALQPTLF